MFENFLDHCRAEWKSSPARAVAGESSAWSYCVPLLRAAPSYRRVTAGKIPGTGMGNARENADPGTGPHSGGSSKVNVRGTRGTTRLTSAAIGEVLNCVCDLVIWLMSAKAKITGQYPGSCLVRSIFSFSCIFLQEAGLRF